MQAAQGKALIVDVKLLTSDSAAPAAGAASGTHFALTPQSGRVGQAGAADPIWRGTELPTAVLTGAGIDSLMVAMGAGVQLQGTSRSSVLTERSPPPAFSSPSLHVHRPCWRHRRVTCH